MRQADLLSYTSCQCKRHIVSISKYCRKMLYGHTRKELGDVFRRSARQKDRQIQEKYLMPDHVHMMISILPQYAVSRAVGFIEGKSAIHIPQTHAARRRKFVEQYF